MFGASLSLKCFAPVLSNRPPWNAVLQRGIPNITSDCGECHLMVLNRQQQGPLLFGGRSGHSDWPQEVRTRGLDESCNGVFPRKNCPTQKTNNAFPPRDSELVSPGTETSSKLFKKKCLLILGKGGGGRGEKERETETSTGETSIGCLPYVPQPGMGPATQACCWTGY